MTPGAELVLFPELVLTGYPPEDLLLKEHFLQGAQEALADVAGAAEGIVALVGFPERTEDVYNALAVLADGEVHSVYRKTLLPNYGVFDEQRYFQAGGDATVLDLGHARIGLTICEDIWTPGHPASDEALAGATLIVNASASPYHAGKGRQREQMLVQRARDNLSAVAFCNCVGGQDELVFDGHSVVIDHEGTRDRAGAAVRGGADGVHGRPPGRGHRAAARHPAATAGAARAAERAPRRAGWSARRSSRAASAATSRGCSIPSPRSTRRSSSACATTARRTASSTSCSASRAGSTRRSCCCSPSTPSAPTA